MTIEEKRAYTEVLIILEKLRLTDRIPWELLDIMRSNQDSNWQFDFNENEQLENHKMLKLTVIILSTLFIAYICENEEEKLELQEIYLENERKAIEASDFSNVIKEKRGENNSVQNMENVELQIAANDSFVKKLIYKIKKMFNIK